MNKYAQYSMANVSKYKEKHPSTTMQQHQAQRLMST